MRTRKAMINVVVSILTFILGFLPGFIVRKIFLDTLGTELLGLNSLYTNIIGYLSIVEMGIGTAIIFSLYKPFAEGDKTKIKGYLNYYSKFYKVAGLIILILGLLLVPILKVFIKDNINMKDASIYFILFLINTYISYLFSYKLCILNVAQEGYKISIATTISKILVAILQALLLIKYSSLYIYILIQIVINLIYYILMNLYIDKKYNWLKNIKGKISLEEKDSLIKNVKALFLHKIGSIVVFGTDNLVISAFINLCAVSKVNSYNMIISAVQGIIGNSMNAITPSIGNLLVEDNKKLAYTVHKRIFFLNFWVVSFIIISLFNTITQFVKLWLGDTQILSEFTISIILVNTYFQLMRSSVERFKDGSGNYYQDRYAAFFEAIINLIVSIMLVNIIGLPGVFLGTFISNISVVFWIKPKITYKYVFEKPLKDYFKMYFKYLLIAIIPLIITNFLTYKIKYINSIYMFVINCIINIFVINGLYLIFFWNNKEFKYFKSLIIKIFKKNNNKFKMFIGLRD